LTLKELPEPFI